MPPDDHLPNDVLDAAVRLQGFCREHSWRFCLIGGLAVFKAFAARPQDSSRRADRSLGLTSARAVGAPAAAEAALEHSERERRLRSIR